MIYKYTLYRADGSIEQLADRKKRLEFKGTAETRGLYDILNCRTIEIIPPNYYPDEDQRDNITYYGDEEARLVEVPITNPHTKVLYDVFGNAWDTVGDLIREEKISERANSSK